MTAKNGFHDDFQLRWLAPLSGDGVSFIFDVFVDLFNEQIERRMLMIFLSTGIQLHRHTVSDSNH